MATSTNTSSSEASKSGCALVTGAATGLGREITLALVKSGYRVMAADRDMAGCHETAELAPEGTVFPLHLSLPDQNSIARSISAAVTELGGLDLLVNNAGVPLSKPAFEVSESDWDGVMDVNLKGAFFMSKAFAAYRKMVGGHGSIVNMGSSHGIVGIADRAGYGISKAGIMHMTRMLAVEWAPLGIRVNSVAPGTVLTPSRTKLLDDPEVREKMRARIPLGEFITSAEVAAAVVYLASAGAGSITGHSIVVDGGATVW